MGYTAQQQGRLDAALKRLQTAQSSYAGNVTRYNDWTSSIAGCYKDPFGTASEASTWYTPQNGPCRELKSQCKGTSYQNCKDVIQKLQDDIIPALRSAYAELNTAQANYTKVLDEVAKEVVSDPDFISQQNQIKSDAEANAASTTQKYIFWTVAFVVVGGIIFAWIKWGKKLVGGAASS